MPATFSRFLTSQRGSEQLLDSDGFIYGRKKCNDAATTSFWRCCKYGVPVKCPCTCRLGLTNNSLSFSAKPHNHAASTAEPERREVLNTLKRKAADQQLSVTQNLVSEVIAYTAPEVNRVLPNMQSMGQVVRRSGTTMIQL